MVMRLENRKGDHPACADCVHFSRGDDGLTCTRNECSTYDCVEGRQPTQAKAARSSGVCGASARYFERRPGPTWLDQHGGSIMLTVVVIGVAAYLTKGALW